MLAADLLHQCSPLQRAVSRELVRYAAATLIHCPHCERILDAKSTVVLTDTADNTRALCSACYGGAIGSFTSGSVTVLDGRDLWASKGKLWRYK